jgi:hypothetical protein
VELSFSNDVLRLLDVKGFEVKDKNSIIEEKSLICYNRKIPEFSAQAELIDYLTEETYKRRLEEALLQVLREEEVSEVLEKMKNEGKIVLKRVMI